MLFASILVGYKIDWAHIIAEQFHESAVRIQQMLPFPILIYRLSKEAGVRVSLYLGPYIEAVHMIDSSIIKADENPVAL